MDHVVESGDLPIGVSENREVDLGPLRLLDIGYPALVRRERIDGERDHLGLSLFKLAFQLGDPPELGRADGSEIGRMGKQNAPAVSQPGVKRNLPGGRVLFEV